MSKNVFVDLGFSEQEAAGLKLRSHLFIALQEVIRQSGKSQKVIADIIGADQPKVSKILNGNFSEFSIERITAYLDRLGYEIDVRVVQCSTLKSTRSKKKTASVSKSRLVAKTG